LGLAVAVAVAEKLAALAQAGVESGPRLDDYFPALSLQFLFAQDYFRIALAPEKDDAL
jgi:hypothetical protein